MEKDISICCANIIGEFSCIIYNKEMICHNEKNGV